MTPEQAKDPEYLEYLNKKYTGTLNFLDGLTDGERASIYREGMIAFAYHLANFAGEDAETQYKSLFSGAIEVGAERANVNQKEQ